MKDFDDGLRKWNNKCPQCSANIYFRLYSGKLGATSVARCANNLSSSRVMSLQEIADGTLKVCTWEGYAVRMWDGSVRFKEKNGRYLFEY
jgi:hypothetical protein